jgi:CrcB protein
MTALGWPFIVAAAAGAVARFVVDRGVQARVHSTFPWGTLAVNLLGCVALGLLVGLARHESLDDDALFALGTGGVGSFTTFSTVSIQVVRFALDDDAADVAVRYLSATIVLGAVAAAAGLGTAAAMG